MSDPCSPGSAASTSASNGPECESCSRPKPSPTGEPCSECGSPESASTTTWALSENQRGELLLTDQAHQLTTGGGKPGQGYPLAFTHSGGETYKEADEIGSLAQQSASETSAMAPLILSAEGSLAKTSAWPDEGPGSPATAPDCSSSSPASQTLFDPGISSWRTYPVSSLRTAVGTSEQSLERWPTSGTAWPTGFSTAATSECRSDDDGCSSSESSLSQILEPPQTVPARYSLSARAAQGILRRAHKRGRTLPTHLRTALEAVQAQAETARTRS